MTTRRINENEDRAQVVAQARKWIETPTPYHHMGRVRGAGVDCAMLPLEVYIESGLIHDAPEIPYYPLDWALHRDEERYLNLVRRIVKDAGGAEVAGPHERTPLPGDFLLWQFGRTYSHGAIVIEWPQCIHAHIRCGVVYVDVLSEPKLANKIDAGEVLAFAFWGDDVRSV